MYLERLLQINMATLATLGALLLGMGQRSVGPPLLIAVAAVISIRLTDITRQIVIGRGMANVLMIIAAAVTLRDLVPFGGELQAFAFAWLLIYIQIILLFQQKDEKIYWLLVVLSLLQVVVATLFSQGIFFGILLAIYMLLGFSAMTLLMMHRQWEQQRQQGSTFHVRRPESETSETEFTARPSGSRREGIDGVLFRRLGRMGLQTLGLTFILFFAIPRFGHVNWREGMQAKPKSLVGFTDNVRLGSLGDIGESREAVMRVRFERGDVKAPEPVSVYGDVYLRGAILTRYDKSQWQVGQPSAELGSQQLERHRPRPPASEIVRQKIEIEGLDRRELFFVAPYVALGDNALIEFDISRQRLLRDLDRRDFRFKYTLGTTAIVDGVPMPVVPMQPATVDPDCPSCPNDVTQATVTRPGEDGTKPLPNLVALAARWIAESKLPKSDRLGRARWLEKKLSTSSQFTYSLAGQDRDPDIDPIEDFVTKHPRGHCEYFATALVLMLRSQGIPARLVSGYKCDATNWNVAGNYYQVRQLDAHTWVEAYLRLDQIPPQDIHGKKIWDWKNGGWFRLDPTPAGGHESAGTISRVRRGLDWLDAAWSNYVVELDVQRQRDKIYGPIVEALKAAWHAATDPARWRAMLHSAWLTRYLDHLSREVRWAILAVLGILAALVAATVIWLIVHVVRRLRWRWTGRRSPRAVRSAEIEFYRRLENLLAHWGLVRSPSQTHREFAVFAGARLAALTGENRLAPLPVVVADAFYSVRFGRSPLDNAQSQTVEQVLAELAGAGKSGAK